jgi:hypothetical protein
MFSYLILQLTLSCPFYDSIALVGLGRFFSSLIYTQSVRILGQGISPSQGCYLHTDIHSLNGIQTDNPSVQAH